MNFASYFRPSSLAELYRLLERENGVPLFLAGGTDILVQERTQGKYSGRAAYDLTAPPELKNIRQAENMLVIGSCVTHGAAAASPLVQQFAGPLAAACGSVGAVQLRNRATLGGNIANASPAGDSLGPLAALEASVCLDFLGTLRLVPITDLIQCPGRLCLRKKEFIREIRIPQLTSDTRWRFRKIGRREALAISRLTLTLLLRLREDGIITEYRAAIGAVFPRPMRFPNMEHEFVGKPLTRERCCEMADVLAEKIPEIAGVRESTKYKYPVTKLIAQRLLVEMGEGFVE